MGFEPWRPRREWHSPRPQEDVKPADEDVIRTLAEIEKASTYLPSATSDTPAHPGLAAPTGPRPSGVAGARALAIALGAAIGFAIVGRNFISKQAFDGSTRKGSARATSGSPFNPAMQSEAEQLLQRSAAGEARVADQVLEQSPGWTGTTRRTPKSEESVGVMLNAPDRHVREAALRAEMALDGVTVDDAGFQMARNSVRNPTYRVWGLWMLGALGNHGVNAEQATKLIGEYLADSDANVRAAAVNALALVGTEETIPVLLDRFRNDASPVVQERAACSLAESGMYTHQQRMMAAASFVGWLDDSTLSAAQRAWALHALRDISGKNLGESASAWREWYAGAR